MQVKRHTMAVDSMSLTAIDQNFKTVEMMFKKPGSYQLNYFYKNQKDKVGVETITADLNN